jgi:Family of unknown function (DUF6188)
MINSERDGDPLVGDELIRITLETYEVHFQFGKSALQLGAPFLLEREGDVLAEVQPETRAGEISPLWQLVGKTVRKVVWTKSLRIVFSDHLELLIPPSSGQLRGAILSTVPGGGMGFDEF